MIGGKQIENNDFGFQMGSPSGRTSEPLFTQRYPYISLLLN